MVNFDCGAAAHDRSRKPEKTSWDMLQKIALNREEPLLDGCAQSVRYGGMIHDGSGKPEKINFHERAESETFVIRSDATEFVNKAKDQVRSRQKRVWNKINNLANVHGCDDECDIHGTEFLNNSKCCQES